MIEITVVESGDLSEPTELARVTLRLVESDEYRATALVGGEKVEFGLSFDTRREPQALLLAAAACAHAATRLMPAPPLTLPLILRAALASDWRAAGEIVLAEGGDQITSLEMPQPDDGPRQWTERRAAAQAAADRYRGAARTDLADALTLLAADPAGGGPALRLLARAIERTPGAIDDSAVLCIFDGWSFIDRAGTDSPTILQDVVAEAHRVGSIISIEPGHRRRFIELLATEMRPLT